MCLQFILGEVPFSVPLYSPKCLEEEFSELRLLGILGSWASLGYVPGKMG
jgi:hypothetical protein